MDEKTEKAVKMIKPLVFFKDYKDIENEQFESAGKRIRKRAWIMLVTFVIAGIIFSINAFFHLFRYIESGGDTTFPYLMIGWAGLAIWAVIHGAIQGRRMITVANYFKKRGNKALADS